MLTITKSEECSKCGSNLIVKNGFTRHRNQRILCKDCGKSSVLHRKKELSVNRECIVRSFLEGLSLCGESRIFAISYYRNGDPSNIL